MMVTFTPSARRHWATICPNRPKPITSTEPSASVKSSGLGSGAGRERRGTIRLTKAKSSGPSIMVRAARAMSRSAWWALSMPVVRASGNSTKANSPAGMSATEARRESARPILSWRNTP